MSEEQLIFPKLGHEKVELIYVGTPITGLLEFSRYTISLLKGRRKHGKSLFSDP